MSNAPQFIGSFGQLTGDSTYGALTPGSSSRLYHDRRRVHLGSDVLRELPAADHRRRAWRERRHTNRSAGGDPDRERDPGRQWCHGAGVRRYAVCRYDPRPQDRMPAIEPRDQAPGQASSKNRVSAAVGETLGQTAARHAGEWRVADWLTRARPERRATQPRARLAMDASRRTTQPRPRARARRHRLFATSP